MKKQWHLVKEVLKEKRTKQPAETAGTNAKYLSNQKRAGLFIAETAIKNTEGFNFF